MKYFIVIVALVSLSLISRTSSAMVRQHCNCDCEPTSISASVLNEMSQPIGNSIRFETFATRWEHAQAIAERDRQYESVERQHNKQEYRVASHLIDAQYDVTNAEIDQVVLDKVRKANEDLTLARTQINEALRDASLKQRPPITHLWDHLQRVDLVTTLCHGQSLGEDRYQYGRIVRSFKHVVGML